VNIEPAHGPTPPAPDRPQCAPYPHGWPHARRGYWCRLSTCTPTRPPGSLPLADFTTLNTTASADLATEGTRSVDQPGARIVSPGARGNKRTGGSSESPASTGPCTYRPRGFTGCVPAPFARAHLRQ
jgi:hypothetical protein